MSPITRFEESARGIWRCDLDAVEKQTQLTSVRSAIVHYISRLDEKRASFEDDPWRTRSFDRVRTYLTGLAADVEELALMCEKPSESGPKERPYVA